MADQTEALRKRAIELLSAGEVVCVVGFRAGRFENQRVPYIASTAEEAEALVFDEYCTQMIAKYVLEHKQDGKVALFARGCETRAINRMIADRQLTRDQVYLLGVPCSGVMDASGQVLKKCIECQLRNPISPDETFGDPVEETHVYRFDDVDKLESMSREERRAFFDRMYTACVRCYACRNACPCCTCKVCFVDQERVGWQGKQYNLDEARFYGLTSASHGRAPKTTNGLASAT